jgi:DNA uptake protein ComE-like DNA-binding protein
MARDFSYGVLALCLFAVLAVAGSAPPPEAPFPGGAAAPLNLNRATPVQLQSVAGLLGNESAVLIAHRAKAPCKTLDDLKAVAGLDFTKIEKRRDRLACF